MQTQPVETTLSGETPAPHHLVELLLDIQEREGFLSEEALRNVAESLSVPLIEVWRVANFYRVLSLEPRGKHQVTVCMGTACHVRAAPLLLEELAGQLRLNGRKTSNDGMFTVERVNCVGACGVGPVVVLDGAYHHHMTPRKMRRLVRSVKAAEEEGLGDV